MRFTKTVLAAAAVGLVLSAPPALAAGGGPKYVWEPGPSCGPGYKSVWVDRPATAGTLVKDPMTGLLTWKDGEPAYRGWECQPITLVPIGP